MNKSKLNYAVDMGLFLAFTGLTVSGLSLWPFQPLLFTRRAVEGISPVGGSAYFRNGDNSYTSTLVLDC